MKNIALLSSLLCIFYFSESNAQPNIFETNYDDTILAYANNNDSTDLKSTKINIPNQEGSVTIITDNSGQVRKTIFEIPSTKNTNNKKQSKYPKCDYNMCIDFGMNKIDEKNLFTNKEDPNSADFPPLNNSKSISFAMYPVMTSVRPVSFFGITGGLGLEWFNYRFNNKMSMANNNGITEAVPAWQVFNFNERNAVLKSKLTASYLNVPIMLDFYLSQKNYFKISTGAMLGVNISSHTKVKYLDNSNNKQKLKMDDNLNISSFRYGFTARIYWNRTGVYANYYMTPLFKSNKGPKVYPFVIGISFNI